MITDGAHQLPLTTDERLEFLAKAGTVLSSSLDYETTLGNVARLVVPILADWCLVDVVEPDGSIRQMACAHVDPDKEDLARELRRRYPPDPAQEHPIWRVLMTRRSELRSDITDEDLVARARDGDHLSLLRILGIRSHMVVPLVAHGRALGVISLISGSSGRQYGPADLSLAEDLATRCALAVDNARLFSEARDAVERTEHARALMDTLLATAPVGLGFLDRDLRFIQINESLAGMNGAPVDKHLGRTLHEVVPDMAAKVEPLYRQVVETGDPLVDLEVAGETPAAPGEGRDWLTSYYPVRGPEGEILGVGVVVADITERKRTERRMAAEYAVNRVLAEADSLAHATPRVLQSLCESLDADVGALWQLDREADLLRCVETWHRPEARVSGFEQATRETAFSRGVGLPGRVWEAGAAAMIPNVGIDPNFPRAPVALAEGLHWGFGVPIFLGEEFLGVIEFFSRESLRPDEGLLQMMSAIANQIGQFIERKQAEEEVRRSEARKSAIFQSALDCIVSMDAEGRVVEFNPAAEETFGYRRDEVIGQELASLIIPASYRDRHRQGLARYLQTGDGPMIGRRVRLRAMRADGSEFPVELAITRVDVTGPPLFTAYLRDVTEQVSAERERAELLARAWAAEARYGGLFSGVKDAILIGDDQGRYVDANPAALDLLQYSGQELIGRSMDDIVSRRSERADRDFSRLRQEGRWAGELELRRKDGTVIPVDASTTVVELPTGHLHVAILRDITERRRAEAEREDLLAREREAQKRLAFLAEASAELASSFDYETTLEGVARLATNWLADYCLIDVVQPDETIQKVAAVHADPTKQPLLRELQRHPPQPSHPHPVTAALRTGNSQLHPDVSQSFLREIAHNDEHLEILQQLDPRSIIVVPLLAREGVIGAITLCSTKPWPTYGQDERALAEDLARRAVLAIDNARLYEAEQRARKGAERTASRISRLQSVTASLSESVTASEVADVVMGHARTALGAAASWITLVSQDGQAVEVFRAEGMQEDVIQRLERIPLDADLPIPEAIREGRPVMIESAADLARRYPELRDIPRSGRGAIAVVPLLIEGRAIGALILDFQARRGLREDEESFLMAIGRQCAQALERARLYEAQRSARQEAEIAQLRLAFLAEASTLLASSMGFERALERLGRLAVTFVTDICLIDVLRSNGSLDRVVAVCADAEQKELVGQLVGRFAPDVDGPHPAATVLKTGQPMYAAEMTEDFLRRTTRNDEHFRIVSALNFTSYVCVPLMARGRVLGTMTLVSTNEQRRYGPDELELVQDLARRAGLLIDNARLYEAERSARRDAEAAQERLVFLAEASAILSASLDYEATLRRVADLAVPKMADWCSVDIVDEERNVKQLAVSHVDPSKVQLARDLRRRFPPDPAAVQGVPAVIRTGRSELTSEITHDMIQASVADPAFREILVTLGLRSAMVVPLAGSTGILGAITFVSAESGRTYGPDDLALAEEVARRAGQAVENAQLYRERDHIARALQQSLLPPDLPEIPGIEVAARYRPFGRGTEVGGDFYDVFDTGDGGWALAIGDVCGKGPAAAAITGLARSTMRAAAMRERRPSQILSSLNSALLRQTTDQRFCTVCYVRLRRSGPGARLTVCCGGHPLPMVLRAAGDVEVTAQPGTLLGVFEDPSLTDHAIDLEPGDALVLYTDGVTEEHSEGAVFGERRLQEVVASCVGLDAESIASRIEAAVIEYGPAESRDDMAIIALRVPSR